jgi:3-carboxy-cis,cis-muconate cycloisomerase
MSRPSFDPGFSTEELTELYSAEATVMAMLEFESALALALTDAGLAPGDEAELVADLCRKGVEDPEAILASTWDTGTPIIALREATGAGKWFHHGATSQDAIDTGQMIQASRALEAMDVSLSSVAGLLRGLTDEHRAQPQMGRTFLQDARPTTFGFRTAMWLDAVLDAIVDLRGHRSTLTVQLGGPVGTRDAYGDAGSEVIEALATRLGLQVPTISWHTSRGRVLSLAQAAQRAAGAMAKIGSDIAHLASTSLGEIEVRSGGSSSMPEKRNPVDSTRAVASAAACAGAVAMLTSAPAHELDRAVGAWHVEWIALPLAFQTSAAAIEAIGTCLDSLRVDSRSMGSDVDAVDAGEQIDQVLTRYQVVI